jgi:hypothetical protein
MKFTVIKIENDGIYLKGEDNDTYVIKENHLNYFQKYYRLLELFKQSKLL